MGNTRAIIQITLISAMAFYAIVFATIAVYFISR